jgi:hypothetical protein
MTEAYRVLDSTGRHLGSVSQHVREGVADWIERWEATAGGNALYVADPANRVMATMAVIDNARRAGLIVGRLAPSRTSRSSWLDPCARPAYANGTTNHVPKEHTMANWSRLSAKQRDVLRLIQEASPSAISNREIAQRLNLPPEGTAQTAASLVRRGIAEKSSRHTLHGRFVVYILATPGA